VAAGASHLTAVAPPPSMQHTGSGAEQYGRHTRPPPPRPPHHMQRAFASARQLHRRLGLAAAVPPHIPPISHAHYRVISVDRGHGLINMTWRSRARSQVRGGASLRRWRGGGGDEHARPPLALRAPGRGGPRRQRRLLLLLSGELNGAPPHAPSCTGAGRGGGQWDGSEQELAEIPLPFYTLAIPFSPAAPARTHPSTARGEATMAPLS
jgi:hypothetical protein